MGGEDGAHEEGGRPVQADQVVGDQRHTDGGDRDDVVSFPATQDVPMPASSGPEHLPRQRRLGRELHLIGYPGRAAALDVPGAGHLG